MNILSELQEFLKPFTEHKAMAVEMNRKIAPLLVSEKRERCEKCGSFLTLDVWQHKDTSEKKRTVKRAFFCKHRFCPMCAWRKSRTVVLEIYSRIEQLSQNQQIAFLFLTLTVPNPPLSELQNTVKQMSNAWHKFIKYKPVKKAVLGYVRALELMGAETPAGQAHPHFHCLLIVRSNYFSGRDYIKQEEWRQLWERATGYSDLQIDIRRAKAKRKQDGNVLTDLEAACFEVMKYTVKPAKIQDMPDADLSVLLSQSAGLRQYAVGGRLNDFTPKLEELDPELWRHLGEEYVRWAGKQGYISADTETK